MHDCSDHDNRAPWIDDVRSEALDDVGMPGYTACTIVLPSGEEAFALVHEDSLGTPAPAWFKDWRPVAPHELTGRLPKAYAPRCGRPASAKGRPCRRLVTIHGDTCEGHHHLAHIAPAPYTGNRPEEAAR
ncbi:hypothetical protein CRM90_12015 [Mycobacterium sp. ENV421]|uniref:hypothetical protein n=1 Tax=Mycobacterium sp. ENV421 TaxID=1213407 RepID=UPI000C9C1019|nr:hypothetical protein [Mycobacterium sp. ENV421]PND57696.1 hypothetical protein CRM90_12015 [Mycobacterium sp. ENV421]